MDNNLFGASVLIICRMQISPVLTAASFNDALLSSGFETVEYIGAFGTDDNWLDGWTNFDPNNTDY
ncbi:hypothetical protein ABG833_06955 [Phocaeicola vulgatus]